MNRRSRKLTVALAAVVFVIVFAPVLSILTTSWYNRWEAARLLATARTLHPGAVSEAETREALSLFNRYLHHEQESIYGKLGARDSYEVCNYPDWYNRVAPRLPPWVNKYIWILPYSRFSVSPRFQNGELVLLDFREIQAHKDDIHPYAAIVRVFSTSTEGDEPELPHNFTGFHVSPVGEAQFDGNGKQIGSSWISREFVALDERASPEQFVRSFNFRLNCLTSLLGCHDARKILAISE